MRKLTLFIFFVLITSSTFAQTSLLLGLNAAGSTNVGFWGINPTIEIQHSLSSKVNANFRLNGFFDLTDIALKDDLPGMEVKDFHRSFYSDLGISYKLTDGTVGWSIGAGGSFQIGSEQYIGSTSYLGNKLIDYQIEKTNFSRFGVFIKNTLDFGRVVNLNITLYRFDYWGDYLSIGPSFQF